MSITPESWRDVTVDTYGDMSARYSDYDINPPKRWEYFNTGSTDTFIVPSGVYRVRVECIGGGGRNGVVSDSASAGGGGGSYASSVLAVIPGQSYSLFVGRGASSGLAAQNSWFGSSSGPVVGAAGGTQSSQAHLCVGEIIRAGGSGGNASSSTGSGGGGGGSAGRNGTGNNGQNGFSAGSGGSGGLANGALSSVFRGRGGAGGRKAVQGVAGQPGNDGTPGIPEIPPETVIKTYPATWSKSWYIWGAHAQSPLIFQGDYGGSGNPHYAKMGFNTIAIQSDLTGNTINYIRLRLSCQHAYYSAGLNPGVRVGTHVNFTMPGGTSGNPSGHFDQWRFFSGWKAGETKWCTLPTIQAERLRDQNIGGFTTGRTGAGDTSDYGYFYGYNASSSLRPTLEISYTIPGQAGVPGDPGTAGSPEIPGTIGRDGGNGAFPGGGAGGGGWGNGTNTVAGNGGHGYIRITELA